MTGTARGLDAATRADLRELVHLLAELMDCQRTTPLVTEKRCPKCGRVKPAHKFSRDRWRADGLHYCCRYCRRRARARRPANA